MKDAVRASPESFDSGLFLFPFAIVICLTGKSETYLRVFQYHQRKGKRREREIKAGFGIGGGRVSSSCCCDTMRLRSFYSGGGPFICFDCIYGFSMSSGRGRAPSSCPTATSLLSPSNAKSVRWMNGSRVSFRSLNPLEISISSPIEVVDAAGVNF